MTPGWPRKVSSSGASVAGEQHDPSSGITSGFLLTGNTHVLIPEMSSVTGLTQDAKYVVGALGGDTANIRVWAAQTKVLTKVGLGKWPSISANGVNGSSTPVVVGTGYLPSNTGSSAYRWMNGTITELGNFAGGDYSGANAVSADGGTVVGVAGTNTQQVAFIWTDANKMRSLVDELRARGLEIPVDMSLKFANLISDDGKTIIGSELTDPPTFWRIVLQ
ncbi:MAG TPA: hypothetical protein VEQ59_19995, partial [Polyangiaceae bacterium]|nr:hypothetical protein [Polyangiaceae bacterium]